MKRLGLIGHPLTHSRSPKLHLEIGKLFGRKLSYQLIDVTDKNELKNLMDQLKNGHYDGFNVTIPYKEVILPFLDMLTPKAQKIGAVNTIYIRNNQIIGDNTDYDGFKYLLEEHLNKYLTQNMIILGSGGAAKACYVVCKDLGFDPYVVSRQLKRSPFFDKIVTYDDLNKIEYDLIINTTPVGMYPNVDKMPLHKNLVNTKYVIDLIYNPNTTQLMANAQDSIGGMDMLIIQAFHAQNIWFNDYKKIDKNMLQTLKEALQ